MRLSLKTKFTLATSLLVLAVVSGGLRPVPRAADAPDSAPGRRPRAFRRPAGLSRLPATRSTDAAERGESPGFVRALPTCANTSATRSRQQQHAEFADRIGRGLSRRPSTKSRISDQRRRCAGFERRHRCAARKSPQRPPLIRWCAPAFSSSCARSTARRKPTKFSLPFNWVNGPFGDIRIGLSSALIRDEISPGLISAGYWALGVGSAFHVAGILSSAASRWRPSSESPRNWTASPPGSSISSRP